MMRDIFRSNLQDALSWSELQGKVLEVLAHQSKPLHYIPGVVDPSDQNATRLSLYTRLVDRKLPVFSDSDVFDWELVEKLQNSYQYSLDQMIRYRRTVVGVGKIAGVIFLPKWSTNLEMLDVYTAAQSSGRTIYMIDDPFHPWLQFN